MGALRLLLALQSLGVLSPVWAACYLPNGRQVTDPDFGACPPAVVGGVSMCCAINRTGGVRDTCLSNGLCQNPCSADGDCGQGAGRFWRESCSDPTWKSPFCLQNVCIDPANSGSTNDTASLVQCATDGTWCCGVMSSSTCCAQQNRIKLAPTVGISSTTTQTAEATSASSQSSAQSSTPTAAIAQSSSNSLSTGIGIGVSVGVGLLILVVLGFCLWMRQKRKVARAAVGTHELPTNGAYVGNKTYADVGYPRHQPRDILHEVPGGSTRPAEMPGDSSRNRPS